MAIPARVNYVTIGVWDMAAMRAFYDGLGWRDVGRTGDQFSAYDTGGAILALFPHGHLAHDGRVDAGTPMAGFRGVALAINVEAREDVDRVLGEVRAAGGRITKEPDDAEWGGRSSYFTDPEGNLWEVAWNPYGTFDARGAFVPRGASSA
jgi:catechol 2,3-dioxygenase-like lactoylglutathione lyase family enzyme